MIPVDEKFEQRWEFRRREDDGDTSTDDDSKSINPHKKPKSITSNLILYQNEEATHHIHPPTHSKNDQKLDANTGVRFKNKTNSTKTKNRSKRCPVKENKNNNRNNKNAPKDVVMFQDLRTFSDSLIRELKVARESMFTSMKEEMGKLVSNLRPTNKKKVRKRSTKKQLDSEIKLDTKPQKKRTVASSKRKNLNGKVASKAIGTSIKRKNLQVLDGTTSKEPKKMSPLILSNPSDEGLMSSPFLTIPSIFPKQLQSIGKDIPPNEEPRISIPPSEIANLMANAKNYTYPHHEIQPQQQQFGSLSHINCTSATAGAIARDHSFQTSIGFPAQSNCGIDNGPNPSGLTHSDNSLKDYGKFGLRMNDGVMGYPGITSALSQGILSTSHINRSSKTDGNFGPLRLQNLKESQYYGLDFRSKYI